MKRKSTLLFVLVLTVVLAGLCCPLRAGSKNFFKKLLKAYSKYQEVEMTLWLMGDIGAEKRLGKQMQWITDLNYAPDKNQDRQKRVRAIFDRLKPHYNSHGLKWHIKVVRSSEPNAFAMPGGYIYVFTGIINMVSSDDELAAVIGHEMGHIERRHMLKNARLSTAVALLLEKAVKNTQDRETWGALLNVLISMRFSREQEAEADKIGQIRMAAAGYNPEAQVSLWQKFYNLSGDPRGIFRYFASHPPSSQRVENAKKNLEKIKYAKAQAYVSTAEAFKEKKENLITNPSFEDPLTDKGFINGFNITKGKAGLNNISTTGYQSLQLVCENKADRVKVTTDFIKANEKSDFVFSCMARSETGKQDLSLAIELYDKNKRLKDMRYFIKNRVVSKSEWVKLEARLTNADKQLWFTKTTAYIKIALLSGPFSVGSVWADELRLKNATAEESVNWLVNGECEQIGSNFAPHAITPINAALKLDTAVKNSGCASVCLSGATSQEAGFVFEPISIINADKEKEIGCSFYFKGEAPCQGHAVLELLSAEGKVLENLSQTSFKIEANKWQPHTFIFKCVPKDVFASSMRLRITAELPQGSKAWFDSFVMRDLKK